MSFTDNINGIPAQDTVLRQGIATLRNTVISNTIKPLTVDHNGVYTATPNNGTYGYSPVTVDTGVYTGATAPDNSIGKDGDHYYQISKTRYGMKSVDNNYLTSSPMRILANEFYVTSPFKLTGIRINLIAAVNVKYYVLDNTKTVVYESDSIQGAVGWNEHTLTTPISLVYNQHYIIAANVQDKGTYTQNGYTVWNTEYVIFVRDLYSQTDNIGGLVNDSVTCMVDPVLETDNDHIVAEYIKDNDAWVTISGAPKMILSTLNATDNGTYNAPTGTAYSSVSVDTGIYTGIDTPASTLGKDGDYYYKINDLKASISFEQGAIQNSSTHRLGHAFYVDEPTVIYGFSGYYRRANDNIKFLLLDDQANVIYESATMTSAANKWNNLVIDVPISIEANKIYWVMMDMPSSYGCYVSYNNSNVWSNFNNIHIEKGVYKYQSSSYSYDNDNIYMATILVKNSYYNVSNEYVKNNNAWILLSSTDKISTTTLYATENITYNAPTGTAYSSVSVNVGPEIILRSDWNALTTAQKQAKGLVVIQDASTGFKRGEYVNGADYMASNIYIPNSDDSKAICEAYVDNFSESSSAWTWGSGASPAQYMTNRKPTIDVSENAIRVSAYSTGAVPYVDLGASSTPFTAYIVLKAINGSTYSRLVCNVSSRSAGQGIMLYGSNINVSAWADDTPTGVLSNNYFVGCIRYGTTSSGFVFDGTNIIKIDKTPASCGRYVTLCRTDINSDSQNSEPCDCFVKYFAVVNEAESDAVIEANIQNLYNEFISS